MVVDPEVRLRRKRQAKYANSEKGKDRTKRYEQSAKGTLRRKRYNRSEKGIAAANRYLASDKGKEMLGRKNKKRIESGKNAEYCRRYYEKMKAKKALDNILNERNDNMNGVPIWEKVTLTVDEAAEYSNIGINRINAMLNEPGCTFVLCVGKGKRLVKRKEFERYIERTREI